MDAHEPTELRPGETWLRLVVMLVYFFMVFYVVKFLVGVSMLFQFVLVVLGAQSTSGSKSSLRISIFLHTAYCNTYLGTPINDLSHSVTGPARRICPRLLKIAERDGFNSLIPIPVR